MMTKDYKHTIGQCIFGITIDIYTNVCTAADNLLIRSDTLEVVRSDIFKISGLFKLCHELHLLGGNTEDNDKRYIDVSIIIEKMEKQQASWYKATVEKKRESLK